MLKNLSLLILILVIGTSAYADISGKEYAKCAAIEGDLERLECFDNLAKSKKLNGSQIQSIAVKDNGKWKVFKDINPIDDSKTVTLMLDADSGQNQWGKKVFLIARCKSNKTEIYIGWGEYLGNEALVMSRVGNNKAVKKLWGMSTDSQATFHLTTIPFLKEMLKSNKMVAQVTPYNSNPITAIFDTTGLSNAIKPLRENCGW